MFTSLQYKDAINLGKSMIYLAEAVRLFNLTNQIFVLYAKSDNADCCQGNLSAESIYELCQKKWVALIHWNYNGPFCGRINVIGKVLQQDFPNLSLANEILLALFSICTNGCSHRETYGHVLDITLCCGLGSFNNGIVRDHLKKSVLNRSNLKPFQTIDKPFYQYQNRSCMVTTNCSHVFKPFSR